MSSPTHDIVTPVGGVMVSTVAVDPLSNVTSIMPVDGTTMVSVLTSPQMYLTPAFAVMDGVLPETDTAPLSISWMDDFADSVYTPTELAESACVESPAAFASP